MGPVGAGAFGTAAYANVPTKPTNSSNALSERFIFTFSLGSAEAWDNFQTFGVRNYTQACKFLIKKRLFRTPGGIQTQTEVPKSVVPFGTRKNHALRLFLKVML